jgi:hypothetical protein
MGCRGIKVKEDYFFIIFIFFGFLYIIIAPALTFISGDIDIINDGEIYPEIQIFLLIFFLLPLIFSYRLFKNIIPTNSTKNYYFLSGKKLIFFCTFFIFFEILFIILALNKNMYFRRIGTEEIADLISRLDIFTLIILRTHDLIILPAITLLALLLPSLKIVKRASLCSLVYFTHFILVCSFIIFALMNSRLQLVFLAIALLYGWLLAGNDRFKLSGGVIILLLGGLFYGLIVVSNIRNYGIEAEISNILNPISFITEQNSIAFNKLEWVQRLDCVELIAKMDDNLKRQGYEWGRAWENPLIATFGSLVGSDSAFDLKATGLTTAKSFLIERHTDIGLKDYSSCMATDLWGNFWIYGLPVASILIAFIFAMLRYGLTNPFTPAALVISIVCAFYFVIFEKEFLDWAIGWIKLIPAIIILVALNPIKKIDFSNS